MGNSSSIRNFEQFPFEVPVGTTSRDVLRLVDQVHSGHGEELKFWFAIEIDENGSLQLDPQDEPGKAYELPDALKSLITALAPLQQEPHELQGLRFNFELWGREAGDATLYRSDGTGLFRIQGEILFSGEPKPV